MEEAINRDKGFIGAMSFYFNFVLARLVRVLLAIFDKKGPIDVAMISVYRDEEDVKKFGFKSANHLPDVLSWVRYAWHGKKGRLFMIGSTTEQIAGDTATDESTKRAYRQFFKAVDVAVGHGAKTILYAAATKRIPYHNFLKHLYPHVTFTLGDNFTGLLLGERMMEALERADLNSKQSRILIIAPYGLLGGCALHYALHSGAKVSVIGSPKREAQLVKLAKAHKVDCHTDFYGVGPVDMVVACNSAAWSRLSADRVDAIRHVNRKLIVIDPNEPQNMPPEVFNVVRDRVIRLDAGNGYSSELKYVLGPLCYKALRMAKGVTWGCFSESFILSFHTEIRHHDWMKITPENIAIMSSYFGEGAGMFQLPEPTCFNMPVNDFSLDTVVLNFVEHPQIEVAAN